jgi:hypothetical protein
MLTAIAIGTGLLGGLAGFVLLMPSVMAWDSGNPPLDLKILSYAGLSTIPVSILSTATVIVTQNKLGFVFYLIPALGIIGPLAFNVIKSKLTNSEDVSVDNNNTNLPPVI